MATRRVHRVQPNCGRESCNHPKSFHQYVDPKTHRADPACRVLGCECESWEDPVVQPVAV